MRILVSVLLAACATTSSRPPTGGPRGLRASEHLDAAHQHDDSARHASSWPDGMSASPVLVTGPWLRSWDTAAEHERMAEVHRSTAGDLQAAYDEACGARTLEEVSVSPLQRYGIGGRPTSTGVIVELTGNAGLPDRLIADLKCHRAWMMLSPARMDDCPLDLPGIQLDARGDSDGITVSIVVRDPRLVDELHRRVARELELGADLHRRPPR